MLQKREQGLPETVPVDQSTPAPALLPAHAMRLPLPAYTGASVLHRPMPLPMTGRYGPVAPALSATAANPVVTNTNTKIGIGWRRFGLVDLCLVWIITREWIIFWEYALNSLL
jgi:hypothetical protein